MSLAIDGAKLIMTIIIKTVENQRGSRSAKRVITLERKCPS